MKKTNKIEICLIIVIFVTLFIIITYTPIIYKYKNNGALIINEVMSSNKTTLASNNGIYNDYIELYNGYDYDINLKDYYLSDDNFNLRKWRFPEVTIKSNNYLIVYADGTDTYADNEIHTNFKLKKNGEVLTLSDSATNVLSRIYYTETLSDTSYGYNGHEYVYYYQPSPGKINNPNYSKEVIKEEKNDTQLMITEYSKENNAKIELYNGNDYDINLENYYLSNEEVLPYKYIFPKVIIKANTYLTLYADGIDKVDNDIIHLNFNLKYDDNILTLTDNLKNTIEKLYLQKFTSNMSCGYYNDNWYYYNEMSFGKENTANYLKNEIVTAKYIRINEVSSTKIELKNLTNDDINLKNYAIGDKGGAISDINKTIKGNSYLVIDTDNLDFNINNGSEVIYLYYNGKIIDEYSVGRLMGDNSSGINDEGNRVFYTKVTMGQDNSKNYYLGYATEPSFSVDGGYINKGSMVTLLVDSDSIIYYTIDGSMPSNRSLKYTDGIVVNKTTVIKAIVYKDGYLPSDIVSRTFFIGRNHNLPVISISSDNSNFYGFSGIITNYYQNINKEINFEFYEADGLLGISFLGDTKLSGMDSRLKPQKSMSIYLRKKYGLKEVTYPFFGNYENTTYSSLLLRNAGEDPKNIRIMDAVLTRTLKGQMDIDMQDYRPVVVYINGEYYGLYNLREKLNADYVETKFGISKDDIDLIKYTTPVKGSTSEYDSLVNFINNNDMRNAKNYEYVKSKLDVEELCNYWIAESYYGNTDLGNIRYWKAKDGKWRFMLYDLGWAMWSSSVNMSYPVIYNDIPAVTYLYSSINITRRLYQNEEFKDLYLKTLAYHLKNTFKPERMNKIVDELASEIESEIPYHFNRWQTGNVNNWHNNLSSFKSMITNRYNYVVNNLKYQFNLSNSEYNKYFGELG